ncbi:MAG: fluoride efflux transporter CrcB [Caldilineaceae bacterium]|nr:fluoride efflux transporter CrcB [Caldilineaceae bacterium]
MTVDGFRAIAGQVVWIGLGAVLGANARYFVSLWLAAKLGAEFPYGTLAVNVSGSLLLGFLVAAGSHYLALSPQLRLMMTVGFLGSFTTFSTFAVESMALWQNGRAWAALANILANNGISLVCALLGILLARQLLPCDLCD